MTTPNLTAVRSMIASRTSTALGEARQKLQQEAGSIKQTNNQKAQQAQQKSVNKAKQNAKATLSVSIRPAERIQPRIASMSQALREYVRVHNG